MTLNGKRLPHIVGHRGAGDLTAENTLGAFRRAIELGCDAIELDVRTSRDGRLVLMHDATVDRTTSGSGAVADLDLTELQRLETSNNENVPTLEQALAVLAPSTMRIQIELKGADTESRAAQIVAAAGLTDRVTFTSFFHQRVFAVRALLPQVETGILIACNPVDPLPLLQSARADHLHVRSTLIDARLVAAVHAAGRQIRAWGGNRDVAVLDELIRLQVDAIGSDRPDLAIARVRAAADTDST